MPLTTDQREIRDFKFMMQIYIGIFVFFYFVYYNLYKRDPNNYDISGLNKVGDEADIFFYTTNIHTGLGHAQLVSHSFYSKLFEAIHTHIMWIIGAGVISAITIDALKDSEK